MTPPTGQAMTALPARQGHFTRQPWDGTLEPVQKHRRHTPLFKPPAAFWTSSLRPDGTAAWTDYLASVDRRMPPWRVVFAVVSPPRLLVLRRDRDLRAAIRQLGLEAGQDLRDLPETFLTNGFHRAFWARVAQVYDAVHVPADFDYHACFSGWDCESTAWLRPTQHLRLLAVEPTHTPPPSRNTTMARATPEELLTEILAYADDMAQVHKFGTMPYADWYPRLMRAAGDFGDTPLERTLAELLHRVATEQGCLVGGKNPVDIPDDLLDRLRGHGSEAAPGFGPR